VPRVACRAKSRTQYLDQKVAVGTCLRFGTKVVPFQCPNINNQKIFWVFFGKKILLCHSWPTNMTPAVTVRHG